MRSPDVIVVGGGVIGLAIAVEAARRGLTVDVFETQFPGGASRAAAGLIAPTLGTAPPGVTSLFTEAARGYPAFLERVEEIGGRRVPIGWGVLEVVGEADDSRPPAKGAEDRGGGMSPGVTVLEAAAVREMEPELTAPAGAMFHALDGWLDPGTLVEALQHAATQLGTVRQLSATVRAVRRVEAEIEVQVGEGEGEDQRGEGHRAPTVVIAAGAWSPRIAGIPRTIPVSPARGQLLSIEGPHTLRHAVAFDDGYLVPRSNGVIVGSTMERVGFDPTTTPEGLQGLGEAASRVIPGVVERATGRRGWAGLRPVTPDLLPIIDRDPEWPGLLYACGHSKNGVLLAPMTAQAVVAMMVGERPGREMSAFALARFGR